MAPSQRHSMSSASPSSSPSAGEEEPLQFIRIDDDGRCHVEERAIALLEAYPARLAVVGIAGLYRTGKSFLLNRLLGRQQGFTTGPTVNACTKGLWIWGKPIELAPNFHCVLLDTEGLGSAERSASCDMQIISLCLLLSSYFIYNSLGAIDEQGIDDLNLVLKLASHIHSKRCTDAPKSSEELAPHFPAFLWVVRDFHLRLSDEQGREVPEQQYLEGALADVPTQAERNRTRATIRGLFQQRDCVTLPRPVAEEEELRMLDRLPYDALREKFRSKVEAFVEKVFSEAKPKAVNGTALTGAMLAGLAREYCAAINNSAVPTIHSAWDATVLHQLRMSQKAALEVYNKCMRKEEAGRVPVSEERLHEVHRSAKEAALDVFHTARFDEADPRLLEHAEKLEEQIRGHFDEFRRLNASASDERCRQVAQELYNSRIEAKLCSLGYESVEQLMHDWEQLRAEYLVRTAGPAQAEVLSTWLFQKMADTVQRVAGDLCREASPLGKAEEPKKEAPDGAMAAVAARNVQGATEVVVSPSLPRAADDSTVEVTAGEVAMPDRHLLPALTEHSARYLEAVALRRRRLAAARRFYLDVMAYQWRLDAVNTQLDTMATAASAVAAGGAAADGQQDAACRRQAFEAATAGIRRQRAAAVAALEDRAAKPGLCASPSSNGEVTRLAESEADRQEAIHVLRQLAEETFGEIEIEASAILSVAPGDKGLRRLQNTLHRRRNFWQGQMVETWAAWREARSGMHQAGAEALHAWAALASAMAAAMRRLQAEECGVLRPAMLQSLATALARCLEVELLEPLGLSNLEASAAEEALAAPAAPSSARGTGGGSSPGHAQREALLTCVVDLLRDRRLHRSAVANTPPRKGSCRGEDPAVRHALLTAAAELLRSLEALHRVGVALARDAAAPGGVLGLFSPRPDGAEGTTAAALPPSVTAVAVAALTDAGRSGYSSPSESSSPHFGFEGVLATWVARSLSEAACETAHRGDLRGLGGVLDVSAFLGGLELGHAVLNARSRAPHNGGLSPSALAHAAGHDKAVDLLRRWPHVPRAEAGAGAGTGAEPAFLRPLRLLLEEVDVPEKGLRGHKRAVVRNALASTVRWAVVRRGSGGDHCRATGENPDDDTPQVTL